MTSDYNEVLVEVAVGRSSTLATLSTVVGWIYFVAWSFSFYPQSYENWRRKSVVGLSFDFLTLSLVGFVLYALFNCGLYWIPELQHEYLRRHPHGLIPVQVNDIVFALHAVFLNFFMIFQCIIYERGGQTVSKIAYIILGIICLVVGISVILSCIGKLHWLDFLYICSYVKLAMTICKYFPQAYMSYKRKSTVGWNIGTVFMDFTGGIFSMIQMIIDADNYNDWGSIFGDPTKFGLGLFSVLFDIFFMIQRYVLYRNPSKTI